MEYYSKFHREKILVNELNMSLILGFDAGGTFTDSVVFNTETKKIISSGKALTTNFDLSQGIKNHLM